MDHVYCWQFVPSNFSLKRSCFALPTMLPFEMIESLREERILDGKGKIKSDGKAEQCSKVEPAQAPACVAFKKNPNAFAFHPLD